MSIGPDGPAPESDAWRALPAWLTDLADPEELVGPHAQLPPPAVVLSVLDRLEEEGPHALSDVRGQDLLGVIASVHRSVARGQQLLADLAAAAALHPHNIAPSRHPGDAAEAAAGEVSILLGVSMREARSLVDRGLRLNDWLWPVAAQARAGLLDAPRVRAFVEELTAASPTGIVAVLDRVLPVARDYGALALRNLIRRTLALVDPDGEGERAEAAVATRHVRPLRPIGAGMAVFSALLPAGGAAALEQACEAGAKAAKAGGDARTLDQLRADVLLAMGQEALLTGEVGVAPATSLRSGTAPGGPAQLPSSGATDDVFRFDPRASRVRVTATAAAQAGIDPLDPVTGLPAAEAVSQELSIDDDAWEAGVRCDSPAGLLPRAGVDVPDLAGFGPLLPRQVRALMDRRWVAIAPPPDPGIEGPPGPEPNYTPSRRLRDYVARRDQTCQAPGCSVPALRGDIHHAVPWPAGPTAEWNLRAVCRSHHNLLTHGGHAMTVLEHDLAPPVLRWATPAGTVRFRLPDGSAVPEPRYRAFVRSFDPPPGPPEWEPDRIRKPWRPPDVGPSSR